MKLGIVGTGMISCELMTQVIPHIPSIQVTALCSTPRSLQKAQQLGAQYHIPLVTDNFDALLAADIDAVYLGVPNHTHVFFAEKALQEGRHVICEKPLTSNIEQSERLAALAHEKRLFLIEAISNQYLNSYLSIRENLPRLGEIKQVFCNFSQYSSRYDAFQRGEISPAFNPACSGGALMDLNLYNLYFVVGLFDAPQSASYLPNIERDIDTSGILTMRYPSFTAACIASKSCPGPSQCLIEGTDGYLLMQAPANTCGSFSVTLRDGTNEFIDCIASPHRMIEEFIAFERMLREQDLDTCYTALDKSLTVSRILTQVRRDAGIRFPSDPSL